MRQVTIHAAKTQLSRLITAAVAGEEVEPFIDTPPAIFEARGGTIADLDAAICLAAGMLAWPHRDPFDRLLAATALRRATLLISADTVFDGLVPRIW
jgi:PIN domain nuclease of toxin-antitoxin system